MTEGLKFAKTLISETDEVIVRALVADSAGGFHAASFEKSRIDYVTEVKEGVSGLVLKTGAKIAVAMPYEELEKKIYFSDARDAPVVDLRDVTGAKAAEALGETRLPDLALDFATTAPPPVDAPPAVAAPAQGFPEGKPMIDKPLKIGVFVRQADEQNFQMFFVMDTGIKWSGVEGAEGKNGKMTKLPLLFGRGPFNEDTIIIDMPRAAFMDIYNRAKLAGLEELDLRDLTRRRDPDAPKTAPPPAPRGGSI
jgi:hypothetical protein